MAEVEKARKRIKFKVRFDYKGKPKPARFFFGGKKTEDVAHECREHQIARWRNVPFQGIAVESIDPGEIYSIYDQEMDEEIAFAPLELLVFADSLEDLLYFIFREEFRRIEILEPSSILLGNKEIEKLLFRMNELLQTKLLFYSRELGR
ncbi:MAG: hypothetical protein GX989_04750 [Firmicutes bacterium]|nr:hypothetical protein [Bacillota bacterium]